MWNFSDEFRGKAYEFLLYQIGPELQGDLERLVDFDGFGNIDGSVRPLRSVVQFTECRMSGASIVPCIGALESHIVQGLENLDI